MLLTEWFSINERKRYGHTRGGRYKSSLGMYRVDLTSNHIATLRDGEYSGYH